jgi:hypothetical protein
MSNHLSAANLKFPGDDARLDLTDVFVFSPAGGPDRTELIMDVNPFMTGSEFHPDAVYRINIDSDGDALADVAFTFVFSLPDRGRQTATAYYAMGTDARQTEPCGDQLIESTPVGFDASAQSVQAGRCRLFVGERSDPFFADAEGFLQGFQWTGQDSFAGKNVLSIALDVPNEMLGAGPEIGVWATVRLHRDKALVQMDRGGNPSESEKDGFNAGNPVDDVANYATPLTKVLQDHGYTAEEATAAVLSLLPDILHYDRTQSACYPNGRSLSDDVFTERMAFLTNGAQTSGGVKPHQDLLADFPFLGVPNP